MKSTVVREHDGDEEMQMEPKYITEKKGYGIMITSHDPALFLSANDHATAPNLMMIWRAKDLALRF